MSIYYYYYLRTLFKNHYLTILFSLLLEREKGRETLMQERSIDWLSPTRAQARTGAQTGDCMRRTGVHRHWCPEQGLNLKPSMCSNQESNSQHFSYGMMFQPTEPHRPGLFKSTYILGEHTMAAVWGSCLQF